MNRRGIKSTRSIEHFDESEVVDFVTNKWSRTVVQPVLIALVIAAFFTAVAGVLTAVTRTPQYVWLAPIYLLVCLESVYTSIWLDHPSRRQINHLAYRAAEFLIILLLLRIYTWVIMGTSPPVAQIPELLRAPYLIFYDAFFIADLILLFLAWLRAVVTSREFNQLAIDRSEAYYFTLPQNEQDPAFKPAYSNRTIIVGQIFQQWIVGGMILAFCGFLIALDPLENSLQESLFALRKLNIPPLVIMAFIIYFVGGFILLSQARLAALNARWLHQGVLKKPEVEKTWNRYTIWLIGAVALIALFLPLGSTSMIGQILERIILGGIQILVLIYYFGLSLLASLIPTPTPTEVTETPEPLATLTFPTPEPTAPPSTPRPPDETTQILLSSAFWAVAIVVTVMAVGFFLRGRGLSLNLQTVSRLGKEMFFWLRSLWHGVFDYAEEIGHDVRAKLRREPKSEVERKRAPWRFVRINSLSPRDQIRYFYLSTIKRAKDKGVPRGNGETPLEFADELKETWPEAEAEIDELTEAFLRARYSADRIEKDSVSPVKQQWKQVKSSLRKRRKK